MTGPTVLRGSATSILWFGLRGVRTWSGPAGARPKLQRNRVQERVKKVVEIQKYLQPMLNVLSYLFLLNWMAKSVMTLIALLMRVISIWITPARRAKVPDISRPLAFAAGSQTYAKTSSVNLISDPTVGDILLYYCKSHSSVSELTVLGGLYAPIGMPTPPPRSNRSSNPLLTGALKEAGIAAGGTPKPAPIYGSQSNTSVSCLEQSKPIKNSTQNDLQQDFLQGLRQAEERETKMFSGSVAGKLNTGRFEWMKGCEGINRLCD